jgi:hypothetical protein
MSGNVDSPTRTIHVGAARARYRAMIPVTKDSWRRLRFPVAKLMDAASSNIHAARQMVHWLPANSAILFIRTCDGKNMKYVSAKLCKSARKSSELICLNKQYAARKTTRLPKRYPINIDSEGGNKCCPTATGFRNEVGASQ